jgi:DNA primase
MKCGVRGVVGSIGGGYSQHQHHQKPRPFVHSTTTVPEHERAILWYKYGIDAVALDAYGVLWAEEIESVVFPCYSLDGDATGFATKILGPTYGGKPKSSVYWDTSPPQYYAPARPVEVGKPVILVEDCLSCLKIREAGAESIALLGTKLTPATAMEIAAVYRNVVFCLDNDATVKAVELAKEYNLLFDKVSILVPRVDPKDMPMDELENLLYVER